MPRLPENLRQFSGEEEGGMTALGLYVTVAMLVLGGLAVDVTSLIAARTQLQVAADFAAHAALYTRELNNETDAKAKAIELTEASFPTLAFGDLLSDDSIQFGTYNADTQTFTMDSASKEAVYVETARLSAQANPVTSFLMQFAGYAEWDVITPSVFEVYRPWCLRDGWVGEGIVDAQSNNTFTSGFCVHSNTHVEFNSNGSFEPGVTVSMPDMANIVLPTSGFQSNIGLEDALTDSYINLRILNQLPVIQAGLYDPDSEHFRSYITNVTPIVLNGSKFSTADFTPGRIHTLACAGNKTITIDATTTLSEVVFDTSCAVKFSNNSSLEDVVVFTTNAGDKSLNSPQGLRLGAVDQCDPAGSVQLITFGGFDVAAALEIYSSQVIARGPISFTAQADGIYGGSFISGEYIDGTSNTDMGTCPNDAGEVFQVDLFRMAG